MTAAFGNVSQAGTAGTITDHSYSGNTDSPERTSRHFWAHCR